MASSFQEIYCNFAKMISGRFSTPPANRRRSSKSAALSYGTFEPRKMLTVFTVNTFTDSDSDEIDGMISLREAITAANTNTAFGDAPAGDATGDVIRFASSLAFEEIKLTGGEIAITDDLIVRGYSNLHIPISALGQSRIFNVDTSERVLMFRLNLTRGNAVEGGAIRVKGGGVLKISQSLLGDNYSDQEGSRGGAIFNVDSRVFIGRSILSGNRSLEAGGAIFSESGLINIFESEFSRNESTRGGAVAGNAGNFAFNRSTFSRNISEEDGGAIAFADNEASAVILKSSFFSNRARTGSGGAIYALESDRVYIYNETYFTENFATRVETLTAEELFSRNELKGSGGAIDTAGVLRIGNTSFYRNAATAAGGAIAASGQRLIINNTKFVSNSAGLTGGAIVSGALRASFRGNSFSENRLTREGGHPLSQFFSSGGAITLLGDPAEPQASAEIRTNSFTSNNSRNSGGAIASYQTNLLIADSSFNQNYTRGLQENELLGGGAIFSFESNLRIARSAIDDNETKGQGGTGGGIYSIAGHLEITDSTVTVNYSNSSGGGIALLDNSALISNTIISDNSAVELGGGVMVFDSQSLTSSNELRSVRILGGSISENTSLRDAGGGIAVLDNARVTINPMSNGQRTEFRDNKAPVSGGGAIFNGGFLALDSVDFIANSARSGGALYTDSERNVILVENRFETNSASTEGSAVYVAAENRDNFFERNSFLNNIADIDQQDIFFQA